ncbi:MAG TPA: hypothetical protein VK730_00945 [Solirubrobacteraceae bacterium]|jgi:hypothetical protein|nr:hypothetical protein [Solirubrobacteraceae bacterium]
MRSAPCSRTSRRAQTRWANRRLPDAYLQGIASQFTGLDLARWTSDRRDPELANEIAGDARAAENAGLTGTPSFLIGASGDAMSRYSSSDPTSFDAAIDGLLKGAA